ncbi:hypothetical protein EVAR_45740_1 [Eumeta japonica]|uniref:Uncharacterized protein n=1 Tax=Eumeta variegata TaxID=151549 RepID=A0A4C1YTG6_EUMVA|nr:hypothetical protein EVAR_45740_1 [Eumeta japonica]
MPKGASTVPRGTLLPYRILESFLYWKKSSRRADLYARRPAPGRAAKIIITPRIESATELSSRAACESVVFDEA